MYRLTIIVTIYKVKEYIFECLESIREQSYDRFTVMMIVGDTDDECIKVCKEFEKDDSRFVTVQTPPRGLSDARNVGINMTETEFITFVDGDDYLQKDMILYLMKSMYNYNSDVSIGNYLVCEDGREKKRRRLLKNGVYGSTDGLKMFLCGHDTQFVSAWGKIYRTSLFKNNDITYPIGVLHEDNLTTYKLLYHANKISVDNHAIYCYLNREMSLSHNKNLEKEAIIIDRMDELEKYLRDRDELKEYVEAYKISSYVNMMIKCATANSKEADERFDNLMNEIGQFRIIQNNNIRIRMKVLCSVLIQFPNLSKKIIGRVVR